MEICLHGGLSKDYITGSKDKLNENFSIVLKYRFGVPSRQISFVKRLNGLLKRSSSYS